MNREQAGNLGLHGASACARRGDRAFEFVLPSNERPEGILHLTERVDESFALGVRTSIGLGLGSTSSARARCVLAGEQRVESFELDLALRLRVSGHEQRSRYD